MQLSRGHRYATIGGTVPFFPPSEFSYPSFLLLPYDNIQRDPFSLDFNSLA